MNAFKKATASLIMAVLILAIAAPAALAAPAPGNGPGEKDVNGGETRPNQARQGHRWDEEPVVPPVNPPEGGPTATNFVAGTAITLVVTVFADTDADGVRDGDELVLEGVYVALEDMAGLSVRPAIKTDSNGQVVFSNLAPGEYQVVVLPVDDFLSTKVSATVVAGETTEVEIGLQPVSTGG